MNFKKKKLGLLTDLRAGIGFPNKFQGKKNEPIPFYKVGDISREFLKHNYYLDKADNYISSEDLKLLKGTLFEKGTIVFAKVGEALKLNRRCIITQPALVDNNVFGIKSNSDELDNKYLFYYLLSVDLGAICKSGAVPSVNQADINSILIPVPDSIQEQQEIVQVLDAMSDIIRLHEECIQHAQALIPALFQEMFGDSNNNLSNSKIVRLGECIELNPAKPNLTNDLNVTFLGMKDISDNGQIDLSTTKIYEEVKKGFTNFKNEDVLLAKITPCFENGKAAIARNLINGYGFGSTEFYVLRANQNIILPEYVYSIIKSFAFAIPGRQKMTGAAGQKRLPKGYILNYKIPLPDLELQRKYADRLNEINLYIQEQQKELKNAKQIFQSLLHHAFTGELTRRVYGND